MTSLYRLLGSICDLVGKTISIAIVVIMVYAVFMRYIVGAPLGWVEEVLFTLFIWMIMLGAASSMRVRGHVSIDVFVVMLPQGAQRWVQVFVDIVSIAVLCSLGWLGLELALEAGDKITEIIGFSYTYIDLAIPVGCFWMAFYVAVLMCRDLLGLEKPVAAMGH